MDDQFDKMSNKFKIYFLIFVSFVVIVLTIRTHINNDRLIKKHIVTCGSIKSMKDNRGGGYLLSYSYSINSKVYSESEFCTKETKEQFELGFISVLVAVEKDNPKVCKLLENSDDFNDFQTVSADTLQVICDSLNLKRR